jgi:uncharacterized membrane protein YbhN (UPF0104 family)
MKKNQLSSGIYRNLRINAFVVRFAVATVLLVYTYRMLDLSAVVGALVEAPTLMWAIVLPLYLMNTGIYVVRLRLLSDVPFSFWRAVRAVLLGNFFGLALPTGGGEAVKVLTLGELVGGKERALALIVASRLVEMAVWCGLVTYAALAVLPPILPSLVPVAWLGALVLGCGAVVGVLGIKERPALDAWVERIPYAGRFFVTTWRGYRNLRPSRVQWVALLCTTMLFAGVNSMAAWVVFDAMGAQIGYLTTLGLQPTLDLIISLPVTISGVGVREWVFAHALPPFGVSLSVAVAMGYARFCGHLFRALIGGALYAAGDTTWRGR